LVVRTGFEPASQFYISLTDRTLKRAFTIPPPDCVEDEKSSVLWKMFVISFHLLCFHIPFSREQHNV
jgi:hypothetical protein